MGGSYDSNVNRRHHTSCSLDDSSHLYIYLFYMAGWSPCPFDRKNRRQNPKLRQNLMLTRIVSLQSAVKSSTRISTKRGEATAEGGSRTLTLSPGRDFESRASASSATSAHQLTIDKCLLIICQPQTAPDFTPTGLIESPKNRIRSPSLRNILFDKTHPLTVALKSAKIKNPMTFFTFI